MNLTFGPIATLWRKGAQLLCASGLVLALGSHAEAQTAPRPVLTNPKAFLEGKGYKVYTIGLAYSIVPLGVFPGSGFIEDSAAAIAQKVDQIRAENGNSKVDIIGHSQGALAARYYTRFLDPNQTKTGTMVSLGGVNWGDDTAWFCVPYPACIEMLQGSAFLDKLNAGDPTPGSVHYYHLYSKSAVNESRSELVGADNVTPQEACNLPALKVAHEDEWRNPIMRQLITLALAGKVDAEFNTHTVDCSVTQ